MKVNRASVACGPLEKWATAQVNYADMLKRVESRRNELKSLDNQAEVNKKRCEETTALIAKLEHSIASYKEEYALLISHVKLQNSVFSNIAWFWLAILMICLVFIMVSHLYVLFWFC